jgi:hypothetical protein
MAGQRASVHILSFGMVCLTKFCSFFGCNGQHFLPDIVKEYDGRVLGHTQGHNECCFKAVHDVFSLAIHIFANEQHKKASRI